MLWLALAYRIIQEYADVRDFLELFLNELLGMQTHTMTRRWKTVVKYLILIALVWLHVL